MSGGSLCYLYCREPEDLFDESMIHYLEKAEDVRSFGVYR